MKKQIILIIIIIALVILNCKAQTIIYNLETYNPNQIQDGMYLKDVNNNLDRFIGTWEWIEGNTSFVIIFEKKEMIDCQPYSNFYVDKIVGRYQYIENGVTISDNLNESFDDLFYPIVGSFNNTDNNNLTIGFKDIVKQKSGKGHIELDTTTNPPQFLWSVGGNSKVLIDGETSIEGWSLPIGSYNQKILIKQ